ncbi:perilipin-1, partial [Pimephales promelas]
MPLSQASMSSRWAVGFVVHDMLARSVKRLTQICVSLEYLLVVAEGIPFVCVASKGGFPAGSVAWIVVFEVQGWKFRRWSRTCSVKAASDEDRAGGTRELQERRPKVEPREEGGKVEPPGQRAENVFLRILNLRSVSAALESIEKTYTSTKQSHSIIRSVCGLYEKGVRRAGSLAVWSLQPALHVLEPQLVAANSMACRGLDRLEEKVPALQSQPAELAANIKELMSSTLETAKDGIACPIKQTSNVVLDKVSTGYQQSKNAIRDGIQFVLNSKLVYLAEQRANRALSLTENLVEYVLPVSSAET